MLPPGWNSCPGSFSSSYSGSVSGFAEHFLKKSEIALLIGRGTNPSAEDIDKAYAIAKTIELPHERVNFISDVCVAYLQLKTIEAYKHAYQVTLSVSDQTDVKRLFKRPN